MRSEDTGAGAGAREAAHAILADVEAGAYADRAAEARLADLAPVDRRLAMELAFGCVRLRGRLDHELRRLVDRPLERLERPLLLWLRLGLYQLRELRVPDHAAVHETVEGVRRTVGPRAVGLANAVLREAVRAGPDAVRVPALSRDPVGHLTTRGSHPEWLIRRWLARWSVQDVARLVELDNRPPPVALRLLDEPPDLDAARRAADGTVRLLPLPEWPRSCTLMEGDPAFVLSRLDAVVQDPAASAVVDYAGPSVEGPLYDVCAAPGGKTAALAFRAPGARPYVAADISRSRLSRLVETARRLRLEVRYAVMDGRAPAVRRARTVILDAPCTGTGVLRRRPDARWRLDAERLRSLTALQRELLDAAADVVEPGGLLVYATCSLEPEENERQVSDFLRRHPEFGREPSPEGAELPDGVLTPDGDLLVLPWRHGCDGAYAARLRRAGSP